MCRGNKQPLKSWIFVDAIPGEPKDVDKAWDRGHGIIIAAKVPSGADAWGYRIEGVLVGESLGERWFLVADIAASVRPEVAGVKAGSLGSFAKGIEKSEEASHGVGCDGA